MSWLTRRRLLLGFGTLGVAASGGVAWIRSSGYTVPPAVAYQLRTLAPWQYRVANALARRVVFPFEFHPGLFMDRYIADLDPVDIRDLKRFLAYVEHLAPLAVGSARRFTESSHYHQDRTLAAIEQSPVALLRGGFQAFKALALMACYAEPESWKALGYAGPVVKWSEP